MVCSDLESQSSLLRLDNGRGMLGVRGDEKNISLWAGNRSIKSVELVDSCDNQ
jgi:hypothetical protein